MPNPPKRATHAKLVCESELYENGAPKTAIVQIQDFKTLNGVSGVFQYVRLNKQNKVVEEYGDTWFWDGERVEGIQDE